MVPPSRSQGYRIWKCAFSFSPCGRRPGPAAPAPARRVRGAPDHWVAHLFHAVNLNSLRGAFVEYQFLAIYIGVTFLILDAMIAATAKIHGLIVVTLECA